MDIPSTNVIDTITEMINDENLLEKMKSSCERDDSFSMTNDDKFTIIEANFRGNQKTERLVRHQKESYNDLTNVRIPKTIEMFNPVVIRSENDYIPEMDKYVLEVKINFENFKLHPPQIHENNGATKLMLPQEAKLRNFTYSANMMVDLDIEYIIRNSHKMDNPKIIKKKLQRINIGKLPIMIKSSICSLTQNRHVSHLQTGECPMDCGGYFIIKGSEKTVLGQERAAENRVYCFSGKNSTKWLYYAEIKSVPDSKCISPKQLEVLISSKNNGYGYGLFVNIPRIKMPIELLTLFRALGAESDKEICSYIALDIDSNKYKEIVDYLQASVVDANKYMNQEDALKHMSSYVSYVPFNMSKEQGSQRKQDFLNEILLNDLFPHCKTLKQKMYFLGYMTNKVIQTALGWRKTDDRDSYINKRIELTGTLLNNLYRNYFNKMVKEMIKQITKEINNGSWRSTEDYENLINMTNIYKIVKSTTIENGISRALATGDFSIKQANTTKVGVAQVLNRLTFMATLSHLRRINTPLEKSGDLIPPRKLHNTTWGYLCPAETPEGQSIGVVKALSYMAHITIPTNSTSLYLYVNPYIISVDEDVSKLIGKVKVFINGCWVGVANEPVELYNSLKEKKYKGIINIYTSIVFDYKNAEIRLCNDGGRLARPLLRMKNGNLLITPKIIEDLDNGLLEWNDLLISGKLEESVIEYIDPEEQGTSLIMMNSSKHEETNNPDLYTHCEIHPSTIFGILASCTPYPDHNQAPRNTYQSAMAKQALGVYAMNFDKRMDKTSYVLTNPTRPLVDTQLMNFINLNKIPSGSQIHVAIMTHTGYNQEDSVLVNQGSIDRGLFSATIYHTERDEDNNIIRDEIIRCKPDKAKTRGIKFGNYEKLNNNGFIEENTLIENRDVIIAKIIPIKENRNDHTKLIKYEDQSIVFSTSEETYIDKNYTGRNGDGYNFAKVRVRVHRKPTYGDKFCVLPTQQVLTNVGWMPIVNVNIKKHKLCTLSEDGNMIYEYPSNKFIFEHDDDMYHLKTKHVHIKCTLNHRLYVRQNDKEDFGFIEAKDVISCPYQFKKNMKNRQEDVENVKVEHNTYNMNIWLQIFGYFVNYGKLTNTFSIEFDIKNITFINSLCNLLNSVNIEYNSTNCGKVIIDNRYTSLYVHFYKIIKNDMKFPSYIWKLSKNQSVLLLNILSNTAKNQTQDGYYNENKTLLNEFVRLAVHCEYSAHIHNKRVILNKTDNTPYINKFKDSSKIETLEHYCGKVYCVEMPSSHTYYMREDENSPSMIVGNSSRHGQKGTCGNIIPECDMPFTREGLRPDIIINPHAIPSRMTIGQLKETLLGKVLLELGMFGDGTSFGELNINTIIHQLQKLNYESYGNEIMYDGLTGEQMETSIFIGPVFYQRLKHMVNDKVHSRATGPMVNLTRQPMEGRSRAGGLRVGEMERDVLLSHGASRFCHERLFEVSDKYSVNVCKKCGMIAVYNDGTHNQFHSKANFVIHECRTCGNKTDFAKVDIPYANKLLFQELQTINVVPRIIV